MPSFSEISDSVTLPSWLQLGLRVLALQPQITQGELQSLVSEFNVDTRTARRFSRLAEFLLAHFPDSVKGKVPFAAGSAVMLEFAKLHQLSPEYAQACSASCFAGDISVVKMKSLLLETRKELTTEAGINYQSSNLIHANFTKMAMDRLACQPELLSKLELEINRLEAVESRKALMPKMIAHSTRRVVALEIRSPQDTAARSVGNVAATLVARVAVLRLRFDDVVLVMPDSAEQIALATQAMLYEWAHDSRESLRTVDILLLSELTQRWAGYSKVPI